MRICILLPPQWGWWMSKMLKIGIRTVEIKDNQFWISGEKVYLKGFGSMKTAICWARLQLCGCQERLYECLKWIHANCFRTSHYPYAEGSGIRWQMRKALLIIDEVPAIGLMRALRIIWQLEQEAVTLDSSVAIMWRSCRNIIQVVEEMILRDKNHPSVFVME